MSATETPILDAEVVPDDAPTQQPATALALRPPGGSTELIAAENAHERVAAATEIATALDAVIKKQGMRTKVGRTKVVRENGSEEWVDKWHVNVEGWQTLALLLGLAVIPHDPEPLRDDAGRVQTVDYTVERIFYPKGTKGRDIKSGNAVVDRVERAQVTGTLGYKCRVEVFKDAVLVGAGNGRCDRNEEAWRERPEYALEGMAATRAQSRAIAATARWIVTLAGYSGTPVEEMGAAVADEPVSPPVPRAEGKALTNAANAIALMLKPHIADDDERQARALFVLGEIERDAGCDLSRHHAGALVLAAKAIIAAQNVTTADEAPGEGPPAPTGPQEDAAPPAASSTPADRPAAGTVPRSDPRAKDLCICAQGLDTAPEDRDMDCPVCGVPF